MEKSRRGWYERDEITRITRDWINLNVRLTERELNLLPLIYDRKLVRRDHLEIISKDYRNLGDSRTMILNRSIGKMFRKNIIDKIHEKSSYGKGNHPCIVALDKGGSLLLNVSYKYRIIQKKENFKGKIIIHRHLPSNYKHIHGVNQMEVDLINHCENKEANINKWILEEPKRFIYNNEEIVVISDVFLEMNIKGKLFLAYLEYDTGSENARYKNNFPTLVEKVNKYKLYSKSQLWKGKLEYFPMVLLVTEDSRRVGYFTRLCQEKKLLGYGVHHKGFTSFIERFERLLDKLL